MKASIGDHYSSLILVDGIDNACAEIITNCPNASVLTVRVLIDVVRNQGDSPANIAQRITGVRESSGVDKCLARLAELNFIALADSDTPPARKSVWITTNGAARLGLKR